MNMIVSVFTGMGPIGLTPKFTELKVNPRLTEFLRKGSLYRNDNESDRDSIRSECLNQMSKILGKNYLVKSRFRMDPMLFKDHMNINKKRYQTMDRIKLQ